MRKKLSPAVIVVCLLAITASILCVMFAMQASAMRRVYGSEIRRDIFEINTLTETLLKNLPEDALEASETIHTAIDDAALLFEAGALERCDLGGRIHEQYDTLRNAAIRAVRAYAEASVSAYETEWSEEALQKLAQEARLAVKQLRSATQYLMSELNSTDVNQMNRAYEQAMDANAKVYKRLTHYIENELPQS